MAVSLDKMSYNGKRLCEVRATATGSGEEDETLAKPFSFFSNLQKKMKWFFFFIFYDISKISFHPAFFKFYLYFASIKYIPLESKTE